MAAAHFYQNGKGKGDGIFFRTDIIHPALTDITDGTSNTFMIGEDIPLLNCWCAWPYANDATGTCAIPPNVNLDLAYGVCDAAATAADSAWANTFSFRSRHAGGLQFAYADGSVHFIAQSIDLPTYRALSTIQGSHRHLRLSSRSDRLHHSSDDAAHRRTERIESMLSRLPAAIAILACLILVGCQAAPVPEVLITVKGKVTVKGKPLGMGTIVFHPDREKGNTSKLEPRGTISSEGTYELEGSDDAGAPPAPTRSPFTR